MLAALIAARLLLKASGERASAKPLALAILFRNISGLLRYPEARFEPVSLKASIRPTPPALANLNLMGLTRTL
jgi:hypothetical protein